MEAYGVMQLLYGGVRVFIAHFWCRLGPPPLPAMRCQIYHKIDDGLGFPSLNTVITWSFFGTLARCQIHHKIDYSLWLHSLKAVINPFLGTFTQCGMHCIEQYIHLFITFSYTASYTLQNCDWFVCGVHFYRRRHAWWCGSWEGPQAISSYSDSGKHNQQVRQCDYDLAWVCIA